MHYTSNFQDLQLHTVIKETCISPSTCSHYQLHSTNLIHYIKKFKALNYYLSCCRSGSSPTDHVCRKPSTPGRNQEDSSPPHTPYGHNRNGRPNVATQARYNSLSSYHLSTSQERFCLFLIM